MSYLECLPSIDENEKNKNTKRMIFDMQQRLSNPTLTERYGHIVTERDWYIGGARNMTFCSSDTWTTLLLDLDILVAQKTLEAAMSWSLFDNMNVRMTRLIANNWQHRINRHKIWWIEKILRIFHSHFCYYTCQSYTIENGNWKQIFK